MSRLSLPARAVTALGAALLLLGVAACDEDGKTAPERCADPPLPIYDIQHAGAPADDNARFNDDAGGGDSSGATPPCVTEVGHGISKPVVVGTGGGSSGTSGTTSTSGSGGLGGSPAEAGAGGA